MKNYIDEKGNYQNIENLTLIQIYNQGYNEGYRDGTLDRIHSKESSAPETILKESEKKPSCITCENFGQNCGTCPANDEQ